jgi:hypothetical protein
MMLRLLAGDESSARAIRFDLATLTIGQANDPLQHPGISPVADRDALPEALEYRNLADRHFAASRLRLYGAHVISAAFLPPKL